MARDMLSLATGGVVSVALALGGGALIGASASLLWLAEGRVAGISGILAGVLLPRPGDLAWRVCFVSGLVAGGLLLQAWSPEAIGAPALGFGAVVASGLLVGVGTRLAGGCTSGHAVCGVPRFAPRSWVATAVFLGVGIATATLVRS